MEDEEVVPENSDLRHYLESFNLYEDFKENTPPRKPSNSSLSESNRLNKNENDREYIDKDIIEQIEEILSARMLFEEDFVNVERLLSNFKVVNVGLLRSIFENVSGFVVIVLGLCAYWAIGSYVFFIVSIYYSYNAADYLWRKHFNRRRLKVLTGALKSNYNLFRKIIKFIKDSDDILQAQVGRKDFGREYELYNNFKKEFSNAEHEIIMILTNSTKKLIKKFPFYDFIENPHQYVCNSYQQQFSQYSDTMKLYQIYLLVQSEFLLRLSLSLIPNIKLSGSKYCLDLYKIIKETSINLKTLQNKLETKFKCVYLKGIYDIENNINLSVAKKINSNSDSIYKNELMTNIQDMSNLFQLLLIRSRKMENNFSNGDETQIMENQLVDIQRELNLCQRNVNDSIIVLKKYSNKIKNEKDNVKQPIVVDDDDETSKQEHNSPLLDLSEEPPKIQDEIFEAYFTSENENENEIEKDFDIQDYLKKKTEKEYSKLVLQELKSKIAETAKEREIREANAVLKKIGEENKFKDCLLDKIDDDDEIKMKESSKFNKIIYENNYVNDENESCDEYQPSAQVSNSSFLTDILKARQKLIQSPLNEEEYFCNSEEEEEEEE